MNIAFIPVRGGSKSIPLKNIKPINGKPLVYWTTKAANDAMCIDKVIVATDSEEIKSTVLSFNLPKVEVYDRDKANATDTASTESVMLEYIEKAGLSNDDNFFLIQATSPLLNSSHIDGMFESYTTNDADSMFTGVVEKQFHWCATHVDNLQACSDNSQTKLFTPVDNSQSCSDNSQTELFTPVDNSQACITSHYLEPVNYDYRNRPRRQKFIGLVAENGACYINKVGNILRDKCRLSGKIKAYELPSYTAYEIDEESDWIIVEELMKYYTK